MIIKVQTSLTSSDDVERVLIYDESKDFFMESDDPDVVKHIKKVMRGQHKQYFKAEIVDNKLEIGEMLFNQTW